jgi:hypothetical protein
MDDETLHDITYTGNVQHVYCKSTIYEIPGVMSIGQPNLANILFSCHCMAILILEIHGEKRPPKSDCKKTQHFPDFKIFDIYSDIKSWTCIAWA